MTKANGAANPASHDEWMTTKTVAEHTGTCEKFWRELRFKGGGPVYVALSRRAVRYRRSDIDAWMAARERRSTFDGNDDASATEEARR